MTPLLWTLLALAALPALLFLVNLPMPFMRLFKENGGQGAAHVPLNIVRQHAQKHMRANPVLQPVINQTPLEVDGLEAAESLLDLGMIFIGPHYRVILPYPPPAS